MSDLETFLKTKVPVGLVGGLYMISPPFQLSAIEETADGIHVMFHFWHAQNSDVFECLVNGNTITPI